LQRFTDDCLASDSTVLEGHPARAGVSPASLVKDSAEFREESCRRDASAQGVADYLVLNKNVQLPAEGMELNG
jgi:hypothetical protein